MQLTATVLRMPLSEAVEGGLLARSPVDDIPKRQWPSHRATQVRARVWTADQAAAFLTGLGNFRWYSVFATTLDSRDAPR